MTFTPIDPAVWPRMQTFYYFSQMAPTGWSLTVELDVTALRRTPKSRGLKFYPTYLWLVTKNLNGDPAFRLAKRDGRLGTYNTLTPLYTVFHENDKTFSMMWTEFQPSFPAFYRAHLENQARYGGNHGFLAQPETPPPANAYTVSCVPWISFQHFAVHSYGLSDYFSPPWKQENSSSGTAGASCPYPSPAITPPPTGIMWRNFWSGFRRIWMHLSNFYPYK